MRFVFGRAVAVGEPSAVALGPLEGDKEEEIRGVESHVAQLRAS